MNVRERVSALVLLGTCVASSIAQAQAAGAPPPAGDMGAQGSGLPPPSAPPLAPPPTDPGTTLSSVRIESSSTTIKFGLLAQPQYEAAGVIPAPNGMPNGMSSNLFLRRARILVGGTLFGTFDYFFDTDYPNLFKAAPVGPGMLVVAKATPGMNIQDVFMTYKPMADLVKVDVGYMLPPLSHNAIQGAGTLYGWDYFAYTFQHSTAGYGGVVNAFGSSANPIGRDLGVQLRGLVVDGHIEYRAGLFQGLRHDATMTGVASQNFFRFAGRLQVNLFDPEPGFFYAGTYFGAKKILSIGGSFDLQGAYRYFAADVIADLPLGPGVLTAQLNAAHWTGGTFVPALVPQTAVVGEVGYNITAVQISPIVRVEELVISGPVANENRFAVGAAFWPYLHNSNLKLFYTRITRQAAPHGANQINLQWQVYFF